MIYLTQPPANGPKLIEHYKRVAREGAVFSARLQNQRYDIAEKFCETWSCPSLSWSTGGEEQYEIRGGRSIRIKPWGFIFIARHDRYSYCSKSEQPFRSNMICFPRWITDSASARLLEARDVDGDPTQTKILLPRAETKKVVASIMAHAGVGDHDAEYLREKMILLYGQLIADQDEQTHASHVIKETTQAELRRRVERARQYILQEYSSDKITLNMIAKEACLSRYHLVRTFNSFTGQTPIQFLIAVRMEAAFNLLKDTKMMVSEIAESVGYKSRVTFFKAFRKVFGVAPSAIERPHNAYYQ